MHLYEMLKCFDVCLIKQKYYWNLLLIESSFSSENTNIIPCRAFRLRTANPGTYLHMSVWAPATSFVLLHLGEQSRSVLFSHEAV